MAQVEIIVGGRTYELACRDGEEERLKLLARLVDARAADAARAVGKPGETRELLLAALLLADELDEARAALAQARQLQDRQAAAMERCAERIETLATGLEKPASPA